MTLQDGSLLKKSHDKVQMKFDKNSLLLLLFGDHDRHIARIEQSLGVLVSSR